MVGTRGHYVNRNEPDTERQALHIPSPTWKLKKLNVELLLLEIRVMGRQKKPDVISFILYACVEI